MHDRGQQEGDRQQLDVAAPEHRARGEHGDGDFAEQDREAREHQLDAVRREVSTCSSGNGWSPRRTTNDVNTSVSRPLSFSR